MIEGACIMLTFGAVLYYSLSFDLVTIGVIGTVVAALLFASVQTKRGAAFGILMGATLILGALAVWKGEDFTVANETFGKRAFEAQVVSIDRRIDQTLVVVRESGKTTKEKLQFSVKNPTALLPGDTISVRGNVQVPKDFLTDTGRMFEYRTYLLNRNIVGVVQRPVVVLLRAGNNSLTRQATIFRYSISEIFARNILFPIDGIIAGMLVGYQGGLPQATQDLFRETGVLHVLVLSGYNITLLAGFLALLLRPLPYRVRLGITLLAIIMLVLVSGSGIASLRAGIMGSIALFAGLTLRTYQPLRALSLAYLLFFFINPLTIFADPGFHLSFLATFFMIAVLPRIEAIFSFIPETRHIDLRQLLVLALTIPFFMLPYLMYFSGLFPLSAPIANIVFAIVTPLLMVLGIVLLLVSFIDPLAHLLGIIISSLGNLVVWFLEQCARIPTWIAPEIPWWAVVVTYGALVIVLFKRDIKQYVLHVRSSLRQLTTSYSP